MPQINDWVADELTPSTSTIPPRNDWVPDTSTPAPAPERSWGDWGIGMGLRTVPSVAGNYLGTLLSPVTGGLSYPALSFAGGALGEIAGQAWDDDEPFNWGLVGTEGALNLIPGIGKAPGINAGIGALAKYGATQGAIQGAVGSVPRHMAAEGSITDPEGLFGLNLPSAKDVAIQTGFGAAFGGLTTPALGRILGGGVKPISGLDAPNYKVTQLGPDPSRLLTGLGPTEPPYKPPPPIDAEFYPSATRNYEPPITAPPPPPIDINPIDVTPPVSPGPYGEGNVGVRPGEDIQVPRGMENNPEFIRNMQEGGYKFSGFSVDGLKSIFKQIISDESGEFDWDAIKSGGIEVWQRLRNKLGRDPSVVEMEQEAALIRSRVAPRPGEETGRVVPFDRGFIPEEVQPPPVSPEQLQGFIENAPWKEPSVSVNTTKIYAGDSPEAADLLRSEIAMLERRIANPELRPDGTRRYSDAVYAQDRQYLAEAKAELAALEQRLDRRFDVPEIDPRMMKRIEAGGPREFDFTQQVLPEGLPLIGEARPATVPSTDLAALRLKNRFDVQPEQQSMIPDFMDAEISNYLKGEDFTPPEMVDFVPPERMQVRQGGYGGGGRIIVNPKTGRPNLAMGGADPQVIRQLGQSLYTKDRPSVLIQELFQNTIDEYRISGIDEPVRIVFNNITKDPATGTDQSSIVFQDFGRGMNESQLYNEFSDVGKSGKRHVAGAAGGFGFAKAAPFLGGNRMRVESITEEDGGKVRYTFEGTPEEFLNQEVGVPLVREELDDPYNPNYDKPTGMRVEVFFDKNKNFSHAKNTLEAVSENSPSVKNIELYDNYATEVDTLGKNSTSDRFIKKGEPGLQSYEKTYFKRFEGQPQPTFKTVISTPHNDARTFYDFDNKERKASKIIILNNGVFYHTFHMGASIHEIPHVPSKIVFDIKSKVPEGHTEYPFPANREGINSVVKTQLENWYDNTIVKPAIAQYKSEIGNVFDDLKPAGKNKHVILDSGEKYTPDELARVQNSPTLGRMANVMGRMLQDLNKYFDPAETVGDTVKYGFRIANEGQGGVNIARPDTPGRKQTAVLVNPFDAFRSGFTENWAYKPKNLTPSQAARRFVHLVIHEYTHNIARNEGASFTWALSHVESRFEERANYESEIFKVIADKTGNYVAELPDLLREYIAARGRPESKVDVLSREGSGIQTEGSRGPTGTSGGSRFDAARAFGKRFIEDESGTYDPVQGWRNLKKATGWGQGKSGRGNTKRNLNEYNIIEEALKIPSAATTTGDLSAPGRQGLTMLLTPQFLKALPAGVASLHYNSWKRIDNDLRSKPIHQRTFNPQTGKFDPSYADKIGLQLFTPASEPGPRAEAVASRWLETGGFLGPEQILGMPNVPRTVWKHTAGYPIRATNRFFISFLNHLKTNRAEYLLNRAQDMSLRALRTGRGPMEGMLGGIQLPGGRNIGLTRKYTRQEAMDIDPYRNLDRGKEIADFINTATGQGPLRGHVIPYGKEWSLEGASRALGSVLFSPGLLASRMRFLSPATYIMATPGVRKEYAKAAIGAALGWFAFTNLAKTAADAMGIDAEINYDVTSSDFGKFRIGDTRLDFGGGFLQFAVLLGRTIQGGWTSSSNPEEGMHEFGQGFQAETRRSNLERFMANKLNPMVKFAYDVFDASEGKPFQVGDRTAQMFVPLFMQDLIELYKENPELLPWMAPVMFGAGTQTYGRTRDYLGQGESKFIPPESDVIFTGGRIPPNDY